jgi:hypothetical protein
MPRKEELYMRKPQIQRLCELYQEEEYLWNIQSLARFTQYVLTCMFKLACQKHAV